MPCITTLDLAAGILVSHLILCSQTFDLKLFVCVKACIVFFIVIIAIKLCFFFKIKIKICLCKYASFLAYFRPALVVSHESYFNASL